MFFVDTFFDWLTKQTPAFPFLIELALIALGGVIAMSPWLWKYSRIFATWVHEAGHAVFAFLSGRKIVSIKLHADTSGATVSKGVDRGFGRFITSFMGYPAPGLLGLLILFSIAFQKANFAAVGFALLIVLLLPFQRSFLGFIITVIYGGAVWLLAGLDSRLYVGVLLVLAGYFLFASPRTIVELSRRRKLLKRGNLAGQDLGHSDADSLALQTRIPAIAWEWVFMLVAGTFMFVGIYALFLYN